jgi:signal transduction histidine kinase
VDASLSLDYGLSQRDGKMQELIDKSNTDDKLIEEKEFLEKFNKHLEEKVKERTKEINDLLKQKDEFITQLGHDLKTPISILQNILPMIQEDSENPTVKQDCETAIRNVK